jgi:hypothetical protein
MVSPGLLAPVAATSSATCCVGGGLGREGGGVIIRRKSGAGGGGIALALQLRRSGAATMSQVMSPASPSHSQMHIRGAGHLPSTDSRLRSGK